MNDPRDLRGDRGTAAQSGAGDLALLGAVPGAFAATDAAAAPLDGFAARAASEPAPDNHPAPHQPGATAPAVDPAPQALTGPHIASLAAPIVAGKTAAGTVKSDTHDAPAHGSGTAYVPAGIGAMPGHFTLAHSGATPGDNGVASVASEVTAAPAILPAAIPAAADAATLETIRASVATLQEAIGHLAGRLPGDAGAGDILAGAHQTVTALDDHLAAIGAGAAATISNAVAAVDHLTAPLAPALADAGHVVTGALDAVDAQAGAALAAAGAGVAHVLDDGVPAALGNLGATTAAVDHALDPLVAGPAATVTNTVGGLFDGAATGSIAHVLGGDAGHDTAVALGGSDPAAGVATLVGLVSAADVFQLHDSGGGDHAALLPGVGALGAADVLAEAHPADSLLGIADHHDGLLGGLSDHHDGLLGHGL